MSKQICSLRKMVLFLYILEKKTWQGIVCQRNKKIGIVNFAMLTYPFPALSSSTLTPILLTQGLDVSPWLCFRVFANQQTEFNFQQSKQAFVIVFAFNFSMAPCPLNHAGRGITGNARGAKTSCCDLARTMSHVITIIYKDHSTLTGGAAAYQFNLLECLSKYLHATQSCWEFSLQLQPPPYEIFSRWNVSSGAEWWVFSLIWLAVMILSWAAHVLPD